MVGVALALVVAAVAAVALLGGAEDKSAQAGPAGECAIRDAGQSSIYRARARAAGGAVTGEALAETVRLMCERVRGRNLDGKIGVRRLGAEEIELQTAREAPPGSSQLVATTAQLQLYDWEPNVFGDPSAPIVSLFQAVQTASEAKPRAEEDDLPPDGASAAITQRFGGDQRKIERHYDQANDTAAARYYLFGPNEQIIRPGQTGAPQAQDLGAERNDATGFYETCDEIAADFEDAPPDKRAGRPPATTACRATLEALTNTGTGPPPGSRVIKVPRGVVVVKAEEAAGSLGYWVVEDDLELSGADIEKPEQSTDPQTNEPIVTFEFTDKGREAFARTTKRVVDRGAEQIVPPGTPRENTFQRFAIALDYRILSLATVSHIDNPQGIDGQSGVQINGIGTLQETEDLANDLRVGALPVHLYLVRAAR